MGFFDQRPEPPPAPEHSEPAWARPETVLPGIAPETVIVARTDDTVVAVGDVRAYPNGFHVGLTAVVREPPNDRRSLGSIGFHRHAGPGPLPDEVLRFGLRFADGTVVTNLDPRRPAPDDEGPRMVPHGGTGALRRYEQTFWVWPLPPPGTLDVVCEWPARGIPETIVGLDADVVLAAARRAVTLF